MEGELSWEETVKGIKKLYMQKYDKELPQSMREALERMKEMASCSEEGAKRLKEFCKANTSQVKMFDIDIPSSILPTDYTGTLHDIKLKSKGPDDQIYMKHPEVRKMVPRGATIMQLDGPESLCDVIVYANKKFTGGMGDDDESQPQNDEIWREYCLESPETAEEIICMEKLNGDAAHFSGRFINGKFYLFSGSKTTHLMSKGKSDIAMYEGEGFERYNVAKIFTSTVYDTLEKLQQDIRNLLFNLLHHTKTTAICEVLQPDMQHIVDISHLNEKQLNFISFTPTAGDNETTLTAFPPNHALALMSAMGFDCCPYSIIKPEQMWERRDEIRAETYKEGQVLYYVNKKGETFGLAKGKSTWYIILRAIRSKVTYLYPSHARRERANLEDTINIMSKRLDEIQQWQKISDDCKGKWMKLAESFMRWLEKELDSSQISASDIKPKYPAIWKKFLLDTSQTDIIPL